jgi:hypothetical protein
MIPTSTDFSQTGELGGEEVKMAFDEDSLAHLQSILIDLYSDKQASIIREYSCNAWDSHIAAGQTKPIEVQTPTSLDPYLRIKDYGVGLSADDIKQIYSKYGASTKRNTNDQVGMLGLGCKSALTYTNQFNIRSVKDGVKIIVSVSRDEDGGGSMSIVSETKTDESNGVEIVIPVSGRNDFQRKAQEFFKFWPAGSVLLNGREPSKQDLIHIKDNLYMVDYQWHYGKSYIVMGNVAYPTDKLHDGLVAYVEIGTVNFTPSREQIQYTSATNKTIAEINEQYKGALHEKIQSEIDAVPEHKDLKEVFDKWDRLMRRVSFSWTRFTYKGEVIPSNVKITTPFYYKKDDGLTIAYNDEYRLPVQYSVRDPHQYVFVINCDREPSTNHKAKMNKWAEENKPAGHYYRPTFFMMETDPDNPWLQHIQTVEWSDILAVKLNRSPAGEKRAPGYDIWSYADDNGIRKASHKRVTDLDITKPIWYGNKKTFNKISDYSLLNKHDVQVVFLAANRIDKFVEKYPTAVSIEHGVKQLVDDFRSSLKPEEKVFLADRYIKEQLRSLRASRIDDPWLKDMIASAHVVDVRSLAATMSAYERLASDVGQWEAIVRPEDDEVSKRYRLFDRITTNISSYDDEYLNDVYDYLNLIYQKKHKGK